jgi:general secretion pathway protein A
VQPPASPKALADPIYEAFYGLTEEPFSITTDPKFFYLSASHEHAYGELLNGLRRREGLLVLTGETGTGKTTLCRTVIQALGPRTFAAMILNPFMAGAEVFRIVLRDFGLVSHEDIRRGALASADVPQLVDILEGFLQSLLPLEAHAIIVLDEAQSVAPQVLDELRVLTALEHNNRRLVQVVLCGQPDLLKTLALEPLHALNERVTRRLTLAPLPPSEVQPYIDHRLGIAGGATAVTFEPAATRIVAELSRGLPRRINVLCDRALQEGRIEGATVITPALIKRAARSVAGEPEPIVVAQPESPPSTLTFGHAERPPGTSRLRKAAFAVAGGVLMTALIAWGWAVYRATSTEPELPAAGRPARDVGTPLVPLTPPPISAVPAPERRSLAPVAPELTPPNEPPPAASAEFPNNRN